MESESEIERRYAIAQAKLLVAEELQLHVAIPYAVLVYLVFDSWILALVIGTIVFLLVARLYQSEYDTASDALERITGTGKYYKPSEPNDAV